MLKFENLMLLDKKACCDFLGKITLFGKMQIGSLTFNLDMYMYFIQVVPLKPSTTRSMEFHSIIYKGDGLI